jgi:hypothetical protein
LPAGWPSRAWKSCSRPTVRRRRSATLPLASRLLPAALPQPLGLLLLSVEGDVPSPAFGWRERGADPGANQILKHSR